MTSNFQAGASNARRSAWQRPKLQELGNLRDFVREGNAFGKSGPLCDGGTSGNNESMSGGNPQDC